MSFPVAVVIVVTASVLLLPTPRAEAADENNLPSSVRRVERETGGRVLSAERRHQSGREMTRIKVYTPEGRVRVMWDEPRRAAPRNELSPEQHAKRGPELRPVPARHVLPRDEHHR